MRKITGMMAVLVLASALYAGCRKAPEPAQNEEVLSVKDLATQHETEFGGVYIKMSIEDFNKLGFEYGDSVDVEFSNGYRLEDIPYYNGYYVDAGQPLLIAYPGYDYIKAAINYGEDLWEEASLQGGILGGKPKFVPLYELGHILEHDTASVTLRERGKYKDIQTARDIHYTDERTDYPGDEVFANFRNFRMGNIKENILYRSASPCDNQHNRASYVDALIKEAGVQFILNLSDNDVKINRYMAADNFNSPYFQSLYDDNKVEAIALNMNYQSEEFAQKIVQGFNAMAEAEGPYLVHCTEGKDRTGFVCMLIEALAGASYEEIADDYMLTYDNYYKINETKDPERYRLILEQNLDAMVKYIVSDESVDFKTADLSGYAREYLKRAEMNDAQIDAFLSRITE